MKQLLNQIIRFGIVGFLCFFIDYGLLLALTELLGIHYLVSGAISFSVSTLINYLFSTFFIFDTRGKNKTLKEFILFVLLSAVGLGINQAVMWVTVEKLSIPYQISKIGATAIVMVYNFLSRKRILEK